MKVSLKHIEVSFKQYAYQESIFCVLNKTVVLNPNFFLLNWFDVFIYSLVELKKAGFVFDKYLTISAQLSSKIPETSPFQIKKILSFQYIKIWWCNSHSNYEELLQQDSPLLVGSRITNKEYFDHMLWLYSIPILTYLQEFFGLNVCFKSVMKFIKYRKLKNKYLIPYDQP